MSEDYQKFKEDLLTIPAIKDKVVEIDQNPNLSENEKAAELVELLCSAYIHSLGEK